MLDSNFISLSHWIGVDTPTYNNSGSFQRRNITSIINGNSANTEEWKFNNHIGTHIDYPFHFYEEGKKSSDFETSFYINKKIGFIKLEEMCRPGEIISVKHIEKQCNNLSTEIEVLLLKTGFQKYRNNITYWAENPGYDKDLYNYFKKKFPKLKFFGFDTISLTSLLNRSMGKESHLAFLNNINPILVIEDMDLGKLNSNIIFEELIIAPIMIENSDGVPVNCILKYYHKKPVEFVSDELPYTI
jgi:arylformamidase